MEGKQKDAEERLQQLEREIVVLKKTEENYRYLLQYAPTAIFEIDYKTASFKGVNNAMCNLMGYTEEELLSLDAFSLLAPESSVRLKDRIQKGLTGENIEQNIEYEVITKDRQHLWADLHIKPVYKEGKLDSALVVGFDVTERKKAEAATKRSDDRIKDVLTSISDSVIAADYDWNIIYVNNTELLNQGAKSSGLENAQNMVGKNWWKLFPFYVGTYVEENLREAMEKREIRQFEVFGKNAGTWNEIRVYPSEEGITFVGKDITERKKTEAKFEEYSKNLEALVEQRTRALKDSERLAAIGATAGMVGHDIRNPLQAITGDVYLLRDYLSAMPNQIPIKKDVEESLDEVEANIGYINKIVADLQDFARTVRPEYSQVNLNELLATVLQPIQIPSNITPNIDVDLSLQLESDKTLLRRILTNLIINAMQAMEKNGGKLSIGCYLRGRSVAICVEDTGVGIPDAVKPKLFTPMMTTKSKGQGLGLAVVKRLVEALNGTISFESQEGKGTKFTITLPLR